MRTRVLLPATALGFVLTAPRPAPALSTLTGGATAAGPYAAEAAVATLLAAVALAGWLLLSWLTLVAVLLVVGSAGTGRVAAAVRTAATWVAPYAARRLIAAALGLGLVTLGAAPAAADASPPTLDWPGAASVTRVHQAADLDWPTAGPGIASPPPPAAAPSPVRPDAGSATRTVRPGDSLWRIAAQELGPDASAARIAQAWPTWWQANRTVIGPDPDLLRPGTRLTAPAPAPTNATNPQS